MRTLALLIVLFLSGILEVADGTCFAKLAGGGVGAFHVCDMAEGGMATKEISLRSGGNVIVGTLFRRQGDVPRAVIVGVPGTGEVSFRESWEGEDGGLWKVVAEYFVSRGFAFFVYDKPGVGLSSGDWVVQSIGDRVLELTDVVQAIEKEFMSDVTVGLLGFSEGGMVVVEGASAIPRVGFVITLAGPAVSMRDVSTHEGICLMRCSGKQGFNAFLREKAIRIRFLLIELVSRFFKPHAHIYYTIGYDPADALRVLAQPMLAVFAENDCTVQVHLNMEALRALFGELSGNENLFVKVVEGADHLFRPSERCGALREGPRVSSGLTDALECEAFWKSVFPDP